MLVSPRAMTAGGNNLAPLRFSMRDFLNTAFYYRWTAVAVLTVTLVLGILLALLVPPSYRAEARLLTLYAGHYNMQINPTGAAAAAGGLPGFETGGIASVESQILASPELHRAVVEEELGPEADEDAIDRTVRRLENNLSIERVETANVLQLSYRDRDPVKASKTLERLIEHYFRQRAGVFTEGRVGFLVQQRDRVRTQLDKANAQLIAFQRSREAVDVEAQIASAVALNALLKQRGMENDASLAQDKSTLEKLKTEAASVPATIELYEDNSEAARAIGTMQLTLLQLQARRADLAARYMTESPFVKQVDDQIADLEKEIEKQKSSVVNAVRRGRNTYYDTVQDRITRLSADVAGQEERKQILDVQITEAGDHFQSLITTANQLRRLEIDRDLLAESFRGFSREVEQARIQQNQADTSSSSNVRIIQAPAPPAHRSNPPILFIAAALVIGIMAAAIAMLVRTSLRETFLNPEEVERSLALPVLFAPLHASEPPQMMQELGQALRQMQALRQILTPPEPAAPQRRLPRAELGRMVSAIHHSVPGADKSSRVVLLLSSRDDDGLDTVSMALIEELERRSTRPVLILDLTQKADLYGQPDADGLLAWPGEAGLAPSWRAATVGPASSAEAETTFDFHPVENHYIVVGRLKPDARLPTGRQSAYLFDLLRREHDYIVMRVPPVSRSFDGIEAAILADATVLGVRAEATRKPVALQMKAQVIDTGGRIVGVAMMGRRSYIPAYVYRFI